MEKIKFDSINIFSRIYDAKIKAHNISFELSKEDYLSFAPGILDKNEYQRKKIKTASSVYSLMKSDLKQGCIIPPIILALGVGSEEMDADKQGLEDFINNLTDDNFKKNIKIFLEENSRHIKILDGLQRTNMLLDVKNELDKKEDDTDRNLFYTTKLRFEIYIGINSFGILYRMLTLNTGQSPMSLRHQIEILYSDFFVKGEGNENGIQLIREIDGNSIRVGLGKYRFNDLLQGLDAYIDGQEFTLDRKDILQYVKDLENLSEHLASYDLFKEFVKTYHAFVQKINDLAKGWVFSYENLSYEEREFVKSFFTETNEEAIPAAINKSFFGKNVIELFTASQVITGMGAALYKMDLMEAQKKIGDIVFEHDSTDSLNKLTYRLFELKTKSKKIGDSQRTFFKEFFKQLLRSERPSFEQSLEGAYRWMANYGY